MCSVTFKENELRIDERETVLGNLANLIYLAMGLNQQNELPAM